GPFWWQLATIAAVGIAALVLAVVTTERLVGRWAAGVAGLMLVLVIRSVDAMQLVRPSKPFVGLVLIFATCFLGWRTMSRRRWCFPVLTAVASAAAHTRVTYLLPAMAVVIVATVAVIIAAPADRRHREARSRSPWRWRL